MRPTRSIPALLDSGFIYALYAEGDKHHDAAVAFLEDFNGVTLIPEIILPEVVYLFRKAGGTDYVLRFLEAFSGAQDYFESTTPSDLRRATQIMAQYRDANLDLVDCCIVAIAERLRVTKICTIDRRDFSMIRPRHTEYFELFPQSL